MEAQPSRNILRVRPSPNTPSDVSCSSGPCSVVSTRETSPASSTHYPLEATPAARDLFISCPDHHAAAAAIPSPGPDMSRPRRDLCRPRPGLDTEIPSPLEMNPNPFQSVSGRHSKLAVEDPRPSHTSSGATTDDRNLGHRLSSTPFRRSLAPVLSPHPSSIPPSSATISRGIRTPNWRGPEASLESLTSSSPTSPLAESSCPPRDTHTTDYPSASSSHFPCAPISSFDPRSSHDIVGHTTYISVAGSSNKSSSNYHQQKRKQLFEPRFSARNNEKMHPQQGKIIADADMDQAMSYCYDRGNGQYTRLVPVDMLPIELSNIPRRVNTDDGMIVLPVPRQRATNGQPANNQLETTSQPASSPNGVGTTDNIQSRIDSIVNNTPSPAGGELVLSTRGFDGATPTRAITHYGGSGSGPRREKVYCDKWIHDGTCAFTQQGCKYKHEMPHDRATQESLGLFHGYPAWWKKHALEAQRPLAIDDRPVNLVTGRPAFPGLTASTSMGSGLSNAVVSSNWRTGPGPVGDSGIQRSPSSPTPASGSNSGLTGRGGSIGFVSGSRGSARQPRTFASFQPPSQSPSQPPRQPPSFGPIGPPSRAGVSGSGITANAPTTRATRSMTVSSLTSSGESGGAPYAHSQAAFESANPFGPLTNLPQAARASMVRQDDSSGDNSADVEGKQRGAPL